MSVKAKAEIINNACFCLNSFHYESFQNVLLMREIKKNIKVLEKKKIIIINETFPKSW